MLVRVPRVTEPGSTCDTPVVSMDFYPTMLHLAGLPLQPEHHADGQSLLPLLRGESVQSRTFYWHYPHYHGSSWKPGASIRDGEWKLIEFYHWDDVELYNLAEDPGEQHDLSQAHALPSQRPHSHILPYSARRRSTSLPGLSRISG